MPLTEGANGSDDDGKSQRATRRGAKKFFLCRPRRPWKAGPQPAQARLRQSVSYHPSCRRSCWSLMGYTSHTVLRPRMRLANLQKEIGREGANCLFRQIGKVLST